MASHTPRLKVVVTPDAKRDLRRIWMDNADFYDSDHADRYLAFLQRETMRLGEGLYLGRPMPDAQGLRYTSIRKGKGHGPILVFRIVGETVEALRYFHTAQNWQNEAEGA